MEENKNYVNIQVIDGDSKSCCSHFTLAISPSLYGIGNGNKNHDEIGTSIKKPREPKSKNKSSTLTKFSCSNCLIESSFQLPQIAKDIIPYNQLKRQQSKIEINRKLTTSIGKTHISSSNGKISRPKKNICATDSTMFREKLTNLTLNSNFISLTQKHKNSRKKLPLEYKKPKLTKKNTILESLKPKKIEQIMEKLGHGHINTQQVNQRKITAHKIMNIYNDSVYNSMVTLPKAERKKKVEEAPVLNHENNIFDYFNRVIKEYDLENVDCTEKQDVNIFDLYLPKDFNVH
ncbi:hypothetical protein SteCoe_19689 [Stentor coeruleus]|uniref:Uncharacterized protein n=1 Tax=Stentor coeruleus TaxID=5963 RepID=A0A1R2BTR4_9CILI|nr:hypothetical protein SteCoe_19689 [Stentor coeruleus]